MFDNIPKITIPMANDDDYFYSDYDFNHFLSIESPVHTKMQVSSPAPRTNTDKKSFFLFPEVDDILSYNEHNEHESSKINDYGTPHVSVSKFNFNPTTYKQDSLEDCKVGDLMEYSKWSMVEPFGNADNISHSDSTAYSFIDSNDCRSIHKNIFFSSPRACDVIMESTAEYNRTVADSSDMQGCEADLLGTCCMAYEPSKKEEGSFTALSSKITSSATTPEKIKSKEPHFKWDQPMDFSLNNLNDYVDNIIAKAPSKKKTCSTVESSPVKTRTQAIIKENKSIPLIRQQRLIVESNIEKVNKSSKSIKRRKRKTENQLLMLIKEFEKNPNWTKEYMTEVAVRTGLSEAQVYKWSWDQKKKTVPQRR